MGVLQDEAEGDIGSVPECTGCGSIRVVCGAWACWNPASGIWELESVVEAGYCRNCDQETTFRWRRDEGIARQVVRELNDSFRIHGEGPGSLLITAGLAAEGEAFVTEVIQAVRSFDEFTKENDPWGEHDFGAIEVQGRKVFWKIDYYDRALETGSPNPGNPRLTHRVLTVMFASEY
ncbi:MAG: DUF3768 domain-containing protein [Azospirillaceae bacterium]